MINRLRRFKRLNISWGNVWKILRGFRKSFLDKLFVSRNLQSNWGMKEPGRIDHLLYAGLRNSIVLEIHLVCLYEALRFRSLLERERHSPWQIKFQIKFLWKFKKFILVFYGSALWAWHLREVWTLINQNKMTLKVFYMNVILGIHKMITHFPRF